MKTENKISRVFWPNKRAMWMTLVLMLTSAFFTVPMYISYIKNSVSSNILESFVSAGNTVFVIIILFELLIYADTCVRTPSSCKSFARNLLLSYVRLSICLIAFLVSLQMLCAPISFISNKWSFQVVKNSVPIPVYLYTRNSVGEAYLITMLLILLALFACMTVLYYFRVSNDHLQGYVFLFVFMFMGFYASLKEFRWAWLFPYSHTIAAEHFKHIYIGEIQPIWSSFLYFVLVIVVMVIVTSLALRKEKKTDGALSTKKNVNFCK